MSLYKTKKGEAPQGGEQPSNLPAKQANSTPALIQQNDFVEIFDQEMTGVEITTEYLNFDNSEEGVEERFVFTGMSEMANTLPGSKPGDMSPCVMLVNRDGLNMINADAVIVSTLSKIKDDNIPCLVGIIPAGTKKGKNGEYKNFRVIRYSSK